ncbi:Flp family type IVb pilin [Sedimentimonas flavescens]|uniref:Flp family type IVb pilin n=1 Tax=Sedimentimonas flavescens TaxID=2851012 RepID=UPI0021A45832|nr:hypothetical protein [Sedimentimonas flavescens]MCT2538604.1 hypothetical protein [Sedimentimonas flavescens]
MKLFNVKNLIARFRNDEEGVTLVEYAIALVLAVGVGTAALSTLSDAVGDKMTAAEECIDGTNVACQ